MTDAQDKPLLVVRQPTPDNKFIGAEYLDELRRMARDHDVAWRRMYLGEWKEAEG